MQVAQYINSVKTTISLKQNTGNYNVQDVLILTVTSLDNKHKYVHTTLWDCQYKGDFRSLYSWIKNNKRIMNYIFKASEETDKLGCSEAGVVHNFIFDCIEAVKKFYNQHKAETVIRIIMEIYDLEHYYHCEPKEITASLLRGKTQEDLDICKDVRDFLLG